MNDATYKPRARFGKPFRLLMAIGLILTALAWISKKFDDASKSAVRIKSADNLRQIDDAIHQYTLANNGRYPDSIIGLLVNGDVSADVFVSPASNDSVAVGPTTQAVAAELTSGGHLSYVYLGRGLTTANVTSDTIIAFEKPQEYPDGLGANILYGDGRVEFRTGSEANRLNDLTATSDISATRPSEP